MTNRTRLTPLLSGISGEYLVAAELSRRGFVASITLRNTRGIDILASNADGTKTVAIQVKTSQGSVREWVLTQKAERDVARNLFYVFVTLNGLAQPEFFVVPRSAVAKLIKGDHARWLRTPGRGGRPHKDNPVRKFKDHEGRYLGRWDLLRLGKPAA